MLIFLIVHLRTQCEFEMYKTDIAYENKENYVGHKTLLAAQSPSPIGPAEALAQA
jgi:hypothetical protein